MLIHEASQGFHTQRERGMQADKYKKERAGMTNWQPISAAIQLHSCRCQVAAQTNVELNFSLDKMREIHYPTQSEQKGVIINVKSPAPAHKPTMQREGKQPPPSAKAAERGRRPG